MADGLSAATQGQHLCMAAGIWSAPTVFACRPRQADALPLALPPGLVIVVCHLQGKFQQHVLHGLQDNLGHAIRATGELGQVHDARDSQARALGLNRLDELLRLGKGEAADAVNLLCDDDITRLQVGNHALQLGAVGTRA